MSYMGIVSDNSEKKTEGNILPRVIFTGISFILGRIPKIICNKLGLCYEYFFENILNLSSKKKVYGLLIEILRVKISQNCC